VSVIEILKWPDPGLITTCDEVDDVDDELKRLAADMLETMYNAPGRGLAAPQVGVSLRMFVMDPTWKEGTQDPMVILNPVIETVSDTRVTMTEGCLSIPGIMVEVERPTAIRLRWTTLAGEETAADLTGAAARVAQHEIDHLDGIMMYDRLDDETRESVLSALEADLD